MKRVLITGINGLVGKALETYLCEKKYEVKGISRANRIRNSKTQIIVHDLAEPLNFQEHFDVIVHTAAALPYKAMDIVEFKRNNVDATENIVCFARENGVKKFIYLSTIGVYGEFRTSTITEATDRVNLEHYGLTKYMGELFVKAEAEMDTICLRLPGIIGKGARGNWFPDTVLKFINNTPVTIYSPDFETKNFVYVDDLVRFIGILIEQKSFLYDTLLLGCNKGAKVIDIVERMKEKTNSKSKIIIDNTMRSPFCIDSSYALEMGYVSKNPLEIVDAYCKSIRKEV